MSNATLSTDGLVVIDIELKPGVDPIERFEAVRQATYSTDPVTVPSLDGDLELRLAQYVESAARTSSLSNFTVFLVNCDGSAPYGYVAYSPFGDNGICTGLPWAGQVVLTATAEGGGAKLTLMYRPIEGCSQASKMEEYRKMLEA